MSEWYKGYLCGMAMYAVLDTLIEPIVKRIFNDAKEGRDAK